MNNHEQATAQTTAQTTGNADWSVAWYIDVDASEAASAYEAALQVWRDTFGRTGTPGADDACVFDVTDPQGRTWRVDLYLPADEVVRTDAPRRALSEVRTLQVHLPSGTETFAFTQEISTEVTDDVLTIAPRVR